jgi:DNA helicase-2/ATP-dependent DNA helicase PcrA
MNPKITQAFLEAYTKLNEAQKEAVETIDGPVLVIAGPGTGKTQILAARIGNILLKTDARPENILCLTYTEAGTVAMRKRLLQFIGTDAYKVGIYTFHAFCNEVIQNNLDYFGIRELQPISELEQKQLLEKLIDGFDKNHLLKRWTGDVYFDSYRLQKLFQLMKNENWTPEWITQQANSYIAELPTKDEFIYKRANAAKGIKVGDVKQDKIDIEARKMNELKAAANEFINYEKLMREQKRYDYDDMILWVLQAFQQHPDLLLRYQEQYQYFLVDEFQDTNGSQNEILHQLITNPVNEGKPNVLVVGDDDQSIYRFQGANVENILKFFIQYKADITTVVMTDNYRSSQHILDASKNLIDRNQERLIKKLEHLNKDLKANHPKFSVSEIKPEIKVYPNLAQETAALAMEIERLKNENVQMEEIAVIYRNHRQSDELAKLLRMKSIAVNTRRRLNILESPFVQNILAIMEYVDAEARQAFSREDLLFQILHLKWFGISPLTIGELALHIRNNTSYKEPLFWRKEIGKAQAKTKPSLFDSPQNESYANMKRLSDDIEYWISERFNISLQLLIEKIVTRGGILKYLMRSEEKIALLEQLQTFYNFVKTETAKNPALDIAGLMRVIKQMRDYELSITVENITLTEKGVNFITAHSSKGLEFEYVFLLGCDKNTWDKSARSGTFSLPDNLFPSHEAGDEAEESRRLFYVALTRAKHHLQISYAEANNDGKQLEQSRFVAELTENNFIQPQYVQIDAAAMSDYHIMAMHEETLPSVQLVEAAYLRKTLENFNVSVTALSTYLKCPLSFYYNNVLRIPQAKSESMVFGSAVHWALDRFFKKMQQDGKEQFPPASSLLNDFEYELKRHYDAFDTEENFKRRIEYGKEILPKYLNYYQDTWNKIVATERRINTVLNGIPMIGVIDKLEFNGNDVNVVDYKTGQFSNAKKKFNPPLTLQKESSEELSFEEQHGGDYWRQAVFYKILIDLENKRGWNILSTEFDFIEPDKKTAQFHKEKVIILPQDVKTVKEQIAFAYEKIMNLEFNKGCNDPDCKWCSFVKTTYTEIKVTEEAEE